MEEIFVKATNKLTGPVPIHLTWEKGVPQAIVKSVWTKKEDGLHRSLERVDREVPKTETLYPGGKLRFPRKAAGSEQLAGLLRAGLVKVVLVRTPGWREREAAAQAEAEQKASDKAKAREKKRKAIARKAAKRAPTSASASAPAPEVSVGSSTDGED